MWLVWRVGISVRGRRWYWIYRVLKVRLRVDFSIVSSGEFWEV